MRYTGYALCRLSLCHVLNEVMWLETVKPEIFRIMLFGLGNESVASFPWLGEWIFFTTSSKQEFNYTRVAIAKCSAAGPGKNFEVPLRHSESLKRLRRREAEIRRTRTSSVCDLRWMC